MTRNGPRAFRLLAVVACGILSLFAQTESAQIGIPSTPAGERLTAWLAAFNKGDREAIQSFLENNFKDPGQRSVDRELDFRNRTGGFDLKKIEDSSPNKISGLVKERNSDQYANFVLEVEPGPPHRIIGFALRAIPRPSTEPSPRMAEAEALTVTRKRVQDLCETGEFSGAALVARNGEPILTQACGLADRDKKIPNQLDTRFNLGSLNKMFTATAILQLAQQGKLRLTDPLAKYLPDYPNHEVASKVTIDFLLTHTGGTGDVFGPEFQRNRDQLRDPKDYIALYGNRPPEFEPGSRWAYSNYGFVLLGRIIEKVSGRSYYDYVRDHIYASAGMKDSDSYLKTASIANRAIGYARDDANGALKPNVDSLPARGSPAGGGYSTVQDLLRFAQALLEHELLNAEYTTLLTTGKVEAPGGKYAYGFEDNREDGVRMIGHNGGSPGVNAELNIYPESGYVVVVLSNLDPPSAGHLAQFIGARLPAR